MLQILLSSMAEAGQEEKKIAEENGRFHEGVSAVTVIVDGGWSKRSHKHSYNANQEWQSSLAKKPESCCLSEIGTSTAMPVTLGWKEKDMPVSAIGILHHQRCLS